MKIEVDQDKCIGCGTCANLCPKYFELIDGKSHAIEEETTGCEDCDLNEVAESCPVEAISITE